MERARWTLPRGSLVPTRWPSTELWRVVGRKGQCVHRGSCRPAGWCSDASRELGEVPQGGSGFQCRSIGDGSWLDLAHFPPQNLLRSLPASLSRGPQYMLLKEGPRPQLTHPEGPHRIHSPSHLYQLPLLVLSSAPGGWQPPDVCSQLPHRPPISTTVSLPSTWHPQSARLCYHHLPSSGVHSSQTGLLTEAVTHSLSSLSSATRDSEECLGSGEGKETLNLGTTS